MSVTVNDIARICGVSRTTVIRALNNTGRINAETKERILQTAAELDYKPDLVARMLVKGRSMTIGVVVVDLLNQYFPRMVNTMAAHAQNMGYQLTIGLHGGSAETEREQIDRMVGYRVDGLILSTAGKSEGFDEYLAGLKLPVVLIGHNLSSRFTCVGIDEEAAAAEAVALLLNKGYRHIVFVAPSLGLREEGSYGHRQRLVGIEKAIGDNGGIKLSVINYDNYIEEARDLIRTSACPTAFLCSGDIFAGKLLMGLQQYGIMPPRDYGLMGFDCIDLFQSQSPALASVDNRIEEVGRQCVDAVIQMADSGEILPGKTIPFIIREGGTI